MTEGWTRHQSAALHKAFPSNRVVTTANSAHTRGVNLLMFDGSVHFVSYQIDLQVWRGLGTRNGGETVGSDWQ